MMSQGDVNCSRYATAMEESEQSESCDKSDHNLRQLYYLESFAGSPYTSSSSDSDSDVIAELIQA